MLEQFRKIKAQNDYITALRSEVSRQYRTLNSEERSRIPFYQIIARVESRPGVAASKLHFLHTHDNPDISACHLFVEWLVRTDDPYSLRPMTYVERFLCWLRKD